MVAFALPVCVCWGKLPDGEELAKLGKMFFIFIDLLYLQSIFVCFSFSSIILALAARARTNKTKLKLDRYHLSIEVFANSSIFKEGHCCFVDFKYMAWGKRKMNRYSSMIQYVHLCHNNCIFLFIFSSNYLSCYDHCTQDY